MSTTKTRTELDTMGSIEIPEERLWGAQTQRSLTNFEISENACLWRWSTQ